MHIHNTTVHFRNNETNKLATFLSRQNSRKKLEFRQCK